MIFDKVIKKFNQKQTHFILIAIIILKIQFHTYSRSVKKIRLSFTRWCKKYFDSIQLCVTSILKLHLVKVSLLTERKSKERAQVKVMK